MSDDRYGQVNDALQALKSYLSVEKSAEKQDLFGTKKTDIRMTVCLKLLPHKFTGTVVTAVVPHPFVRVGEKSVCLIVRDVDRRRSHDFDRSTRFKKDQLEQQGVNNIDLIISLNHLIREYNTYLDKKKLASSYDVFLFDSKIMPSVLHRVLGNTFKIKKKLPVAVNLRCKDVRKSIERGLATCRITVHKFTDKYNIQFGTSDQSVEELVDNFYAVMQAWEKSFPGSFAIIRSVYVGADELPPLPVYVSYDSSNDVQFPKRKRRVLKPIKGELSSRENSQVLLYSDGSFAVTPIQEKDKKVRSDGENAANETLKKSQVSLDKLGCAKGLKAKPKKSTKGRRRKMV